MSITIGTGHTSTRRAVLFSVVIFANPAAADPRQAVRILVVRSSQLPAYAEALEGLRSALPGPAFVITVVDLDRGAQSEKLLRLLAERPAMVVAAGSASVEAVAAVEHESPVISTMILASTAVSTNERKNIAAFNLDIPPAIVLTRLKHLYPNRGRLAIIRGPALSAPASARLETVARGQGYQAQILECPGPKQLMDTLGTLRQRFDFVWCLPDSKLFQGPTVPAIILEAIRHRVPLIGFSEGIVRAGALVGFYPDYRDIGRQTGEGVVRQMQGLPAVAVNHPRRVSVAINERVARALGIQHSPGGAEGLVLVQ